MSARARVPGQPAVHSRAIGPSLVHRSACGGRLRRAGTSRSPHLLRPGKGVL